MTQPPTRAATITVRITLIMPPRPWFDGIYLFGQFNWFRTGCWLLVHHGAGAILEMPPSGFRQQRPEAAARQAVAELSVVFSVHANDRREGVDFARLMASTREE